MFRPGEFPPRGHDEGNSPSEYHATGTIRDGNGDPIAGARARIYSKIGDNLVVEAVADDDGNFSVYFPSNGQEYYVRGFFADGTATASSTVATIVPRI